MFQSAAGKSHFSPRFTTRGNRQIVTYCIDVGCSPIPARHSPCLAVAVQPASRTFYCDPPVAVTATLNGQGDDGSGQRLFVGLLQRLMSPFPHKA